MEGGGTPEDAARSDAVEQTREGEEPPKTPPGRTPLSETLGGGGTPEDAARSPPVTEDRRPKNARVRANFLPGRRQVARHKARPWEGEEPPEHFSRRHRHTTTENTQFPGRRGSWTSNRCAIDAPPGGASGRMPVYALGGMQSNSSELC